MVFGLGLFMALAAINNVTTLGDSKFSANSAVTFAIGMKETGQHPNVMWRAIESPIIIWLGVIGIILTEAAAGLICLWGSFKMWCSRSASAEGFNASKKRAIQGLTVMAVFFLLAFQVVAGEWFLIWQTPAPTINAAFINFSLAMLVMLWVNTADS